MVRIPGIRSGIAIGLLLASSALAAPTVREAQFVGDRNSDLADPANAGANADFRRWGTTAAGVDGPQTFLKEKKAGKITVRNATPAEIRAAVNARLAALLAAGDPASLAERARIMARLALIPAGQNNVANLNDIHPNLYLEFLRLQNDNQQELILPPKNQIKIVDIKQIEMNRAAGRPDPQPIYRTTHITVVTHHLVPTFRTVYTEYPV